MPNDVNYWRGNANWFSNHCDLKLDLKTIVIFALLALFVFRECSRPSKLDSAAIIQARDSIKRINEVNTVLSMQGRTLQTQLTETKVKYRGDSMAFKSKISNLEVKLSKKREKVITIIKGNPHFADFVATADTVIFTMRQRIDSLEKEKVFSESLYNELVFIKGKEIQNLNMVVGYKDKIIKDQEKQLKKKGRGAKFWKAAAVVIGVAGFVGGSQL